MDAEAVIKNAVKRVALELGVKEEVEVQPVPDFTGYSFQIGAFSGVLCREHTAVLAVVCEETKNGRRVRIFNISSLDRLTELTPENA